jgi:hypothetical protein
VGHCLSLGLVVLTLDDMRMINACDHEGPAELRIWARALFVSLAGFMDGSLFLSRKYDVRLFILIGIGTAIAKIARRRGYIAYTPGVLLCTYTIVGTVVASIIAYWLHMRVGR